MIVLYVNWITPKVYIISRLRGSLSVPWRQPKTTQNHPHSPAAFTLGLRHVHLYIYIYIYIRNTYTCAWCSNNNKVWWVRIPKTNIVELIGPRARDRLTSKPLPRTELNKFTAAEIHFRIHSVHVALILFRRELEHVDRTFWCRYRAGSSTCNPCLAVFICEHISSIL